MGGLAADVGGILRAFAADNGLRYAGEQSGDPNGTGQVSGRFPGGIEGTLRSEVGRSASSRSGGEPVETVTTTLVSRVPESIGFIPLLTCRNAEDRGSLDRLAGAGGVLGLQREVELESIALGHRYVIGVGTEQDENWVRQLFSPTFVDFLAERAPEGCYFQLFGGVLMVATKERPSVESLRALCEFASTVAARLRDESLEQEGLGPRRATESPRAAASRRRTEELLAGIDWESPPDTVAEAARPFRGQVRRMPVVWITSIGFAFLLAAILVGIPSFFLLAWVPIKWLAAAAVAVLALLGLWWTVKMFRSQVRSRSQALGFEAFLRSYAGRRGLQISQGHDFHTAHVRLTLPGFVQRAMTGPLPGSGAQGSVLAIGTGGGDRPSCLMAVHRRLDREPGDGEPGEGLGAVRSGRDLVVHGMPVPIDAWSVAGLDAFCDRAAEAIDRIAMASGDWAPAGRR